MRVVPSSAAIRRRMPTSPLPDPPRSVARAGRGLGPPPSVEGFSGVPPYCSPAPPRPLSLMVTRRLPGVRPMLTVAAVAPLCLLMLVSASAMTK